MMNNKQGIIDELKSLNIGEEEAVLYIELLEKPNTHLQLSRATGINRTKVYRLVEQLEKRGLVSRRTDDRGTFLVASDPNTLEIELAVQEEKIKHRRAVLRRMVPQIRSFQHEAKNAFAIYTYEGVEGLKQMQWHELKAKGEVLVLGNVTVEQLVADRRWSEKFRSRATEKGYRTREIFNRQYDKPDFTDNDDFMDLYSPRLVSEGQLPVSTPVVIYNDTVAVYQFINDKRVGVEIVNAAFARTMKSVFEHYWQSAKKLE